MKQILIEWIQLILIALAMFLILVLSQSTLAAETKQLEKTIVREAKRAGIDPELALAIAKVESGLNDKMVGKLGEVGVFQLRPEYHAVVKGDTTNNIRVGVRYLAHLHDKCGRVYGAAYFICFNLGENYRRIRYPKLFPYYVRVMRALQTRTISFNY